MPPIILSAGLSANLSADSSRRSLGERGSHSKEGSPGKGRFILLSPQANPAQSCLIVLFSYGSRSRKEPNGVPEHWIPICNLPRQGDTNAGPHPQLASNPVKPISPIRPIRPLPAIRPVLCSFSEGENPQLAAPACRTVALRRRKRSEGGNPQSAIPNPHPDRPRRGH